MKTRHTDSPTPKSAKRRNQQRKEKQRGIAIITVLSVLMLMSVLLLGFFSAASSDLESSRYYASSLRTRQLTDIATNLVIAQIRKATSEEKGAGSHFTWASQPGAITTFSNKGKSYDALSIAKYNFYSAADMEVDAKENLAFDVASDWDQRPAQFVDLNAPIFSDREGELYFPIVDPRAHTSLNKTDTSNIEGFSYTETTSTGQSINGVVPASGGSDTQRVPMPVQWLYLLDDGTLGYLDAANKFVATSGSGNATKKNPIVARLAFWTDDESCKVNVNTASEGVHWDIPRYDSKAERDLALNQPAEREINRFPGHPSMVSLSSVLYPHKVINKTDTTILQNIYELSPKVQWGGSQAGNIQAQSGLEWDDDRLYATYDEVLYRHSKNASKRDPNKVFNGNALTRQQLERARFFLTANSIAPELTLWGTPKMAMWPTFLDNKRNSHFDELIAFISTIGTSQRKYYWQRHSSNSRHWEIYVHGNGHNLSMLDDYLANFIEPGNAIPGYGGSLGVKYGSGPYEDGKQILTMMWDYCRTTNLNDPYTPPGQKPYAREPGQRGYGQVAGCCLCGGSGPHNSRWDKPWLKFPRGFGRLYTLSEATLVFKSTAYRSPAEKGGKGWGKGWKQLEPGQRRIQVALLLETFCPSHGFSKMIPNSNLKVVGGKFGHGDVEPAIMRINDKPVGKIGSRNKAKSLTTHKEGFRGWGAHGGPRLFGGDTAGGYNPVYWKWDVNQSVDGVSYEDGYEDGIPVNEGATMKITFGGAAAGAGADDAEMRVVLYDERDNNSIGNLIQVFELDFPNEFEVPVPTNTDSNSWEAHVKATINDPTKFITDKMVTRSLVVSHSDFRLLGAKRVIQKNVFQPHPKFEDSTENHAHSLVDPDGKKYTGFSNEREFIVGAGYPDDLSPDFPIAPDDPTYLVGVDGQPRSDYNFPIDPMITGDFDNGIAAHLDGPYINRGDDGNSPKSGGTNPYFDEAALKVDDLTSKIFFSPNRVLAGPGMFGSLPTGLQDGIPWRTLLFRPDPQHFGSADQPNAGDPPDHLFMDLFWMPIVEPYAISMPAATRGKINLNYQIAPFDNIKRATALHALMKAERVVAIPTTAGNIYKKMNSGQDAWRSRIDAYETLKQWEDKFKENQLFRSPSEICEMYLVPEGQTLGNQTNNDYASMRTFWENNRLTGDNVKERPYTNMHARLTTKSNVYRVHMIVQTLKKVRSTDVGSFDPEKDRVTGQWRGSAIIERFIDPSDKNIPDYFNDSSLTKPSLEKFYNYRVLHVKQFTS